MSSTELGGEGELTRQCLEEEEVDGYRGRQNEEDDALVSISLRKKTGVPLVELTKCVYRSWEKKKRKGVYRFEGYETYSILPAGWYTL